MKITKTTCVPCSKSPCGVEYSPCCAKHEADHTCMVGVNAPETRKSSPAGSAMIQKALSRVEEIKIRGLKGLDLAMALIEAGGSDSIRPEASVIEAGLKVTEPTVIEEHWVALPPNKKGVVLYHFHRKIALV